MPLEVEVGYCAVSHLKRCNSHLILSEPGSLLNQIMKEKRDMKTKRLFLLGCFLAVLGLAGVSSAELLDDDLSFPLIVFDSQGTLTYNATSDLFFVDARPVAVRLPPPGNPIRITSGIFQINAEIDEDGDLQGGVQGDDLFVFAGSVDIPGLGVIAGVLLAGEVTDFGFADQGGTDLFDFRFTVSGGMLADPDMFPNGIAPYPLNSVVGALVQSENSTFTGSFLLDFGGEAKGTLGRVPQPCVDIEKEVSVDGKPIFKQSDTLNNISTGRNLKGQAGQKFALAQAQEFNPAKKWFDADTPEEAPTTDLGAEYRLIVENCGDVTLTNVTLTDILPSSTDPETIAFDVNIGDLLPGERKVIVAGFIADIDDSGKITNEEPIDGFEALSAPNRCEDPPVDVPGVPEGKLLNTAKVTTDNGPEDEDPAYVMCPPDIEFKKQVSVIPLDELTQEELFLPDDPNVDPDGGIWFDADTRETAPTTSRGATYRLIVTNTGSVPLTNVTLRDIMPSSTNPPDETIEILDVNIGDLAVGETKIIVASEVLLNVQSMIGNIKELSFIEGFENLDAPDRCEDVRFLPPNEQPEGKLLNTAEVDTDETDPKDDPAWVMCAPDVEIKKQVSVETLQFLEANDLLFVPDGPEDPDAGVWFDADSKLTAPSTSMGATYRLIVTNTGNVPLTNVMLEDILPSSTNPPLETISFDVNIGDLAVGETKIIVASQVTPNVLSTIEDAADLSFIDGFDLLDAPERCEDVRFLPPDEQPEGKLLNTAEVDTDQTDPKDDPAWVMCAPNVELKKQVSVIPLAELKQGGLLFVPDDPNEDPDAGVWFDADSRLTAPVTEMSATYRLIVTNTGNVPLTNVSLVDIEPSSIPPDFETINFEENIGDLAVGETKVIVSSVVGFPNVLSVPNGSGSLIFGFESLDAPDRCEDVEFLPPDERPEGKLLNTAQVDTDQTGPKDDPAWVMCVDCDIEVIKEVTPVECIEPGTDTGTDGVIDDGACICPCEDTGTDGPLECIAGPVTYTYTITNKGSIDLIVTVDDGQFGLIEFDRFIKAGKTIEITIDECPCDDTGIITNTVTVTGVSVDGTIICMDTATARPEDPICDTGTDGF
jgi:uncharacterized repeat protein (TIGR01451 family)